MGGDEPGGDGALARFSVANALCAVFPLVFLSGNLGGTDAPCAPVFGPWRQIMATSQRPELGATRGQGFTTFRVWAPFAAAVSVAGSFNGWSPGRHAARRGGERLLIGRRRD